MHIVTVTSSEFGWVVDKYRVDLSQGPKAAMLVHGLQSGGGFDFDVAQYPHASKEGQMGPVEESREK